MTRFRTDVLKFMLWIILVLLVRKPSFASTNYVCYSFNYEEPTEVGVTHLYSSLWQDMKKNGFFIRPKYAIKILLILAGDVEFNPGPCQKYNVCFKSIRKNQGRCLVDKIEKGSEKLYCNLCYTQTDNPNRGSNSSTYTELNKFLKNRGLNFFHQNVNGLFNKLEQIKILLNEAGENIHILGTSESHLNSTYTDSQMGIDGYDLVGKDRKTGKGGGISCYIRQDLN